MKMHKIEKYTRDLFLKSYFSQICHGSYKNYKIICFGAGKLSSEFVKLYNFHEFEYFIDSKNSQFDKSCLIRHPNELKGEIPEKVIIFIASSAYNSIVKQLVGIGFKLPQHHLNIMMLISPILPFKITVSKSNFLQSIKKLHLSELPYALSHMPCSNGVGENLQLFMNYDALNLFTKMVYLYSITPNDQELLTIYINTETDPDNFLLSGFFENRLVKQVIESRILGDSGFWKVSPIFSTLIYHYCSIYMPEYFNFECKKNDFFIKDRAAHTDIPDIRQFPKISTPCEIDKGFSLLISNSFFMPLDRARQLERQCYQFGHNTTSTKLLLEGKRMNSDVELIVFIIRKVSIQNNLINYIKSFFEEKGLVFIDTVIFNSKVSTRMTLGARGGNWNATEIDRLSGGPVGLIAFLDPFPSKIFFNGYGVNLHYYRSNIMYNYKDELRKILSNKVKSVTTLNFLHSPDDEQESLDYLDIISAKDRKSIMSKFFLYCDKGNE
jgi:hypothetical protein